MHLLRNVTQRDETKDLQEKRKRKKLKTCIYMDDQKEKRIVRR